MRIRHRLLLFNLLLVTICVVMHNVMFRFLYVGIIAIESGCSAASDHILRPNYSRFRNVHYNVFQLPRAASTLIVRRWSILVRRWGTIIWYYLIQSKGQSRTTTCHETTCHFPFPTTLDRLITRAKKDWWSRSPIGDLTTMRKWFSTRQTITSSIDIASSVCLFSAHGGFLELYDLDKYVRDDFDAREYTPIKTLVFEVR